MHSEFDNLLKQLTQIQTEMSDEFNDSLELVNATLSDNSIQELVTILSEQEEQYSTYTFT
jgi:hypothetical protein